MSPRQRDELRQRYIEQLPTIAALIFSSVDGIDVKTAVDDAMDLILECVDCVEEEG